MVRSDSNFADTPSRPDRIQKIANDFLHRRASGEEISEESIIASHPDLMPELAKWLRAVDLLQNGEWRADTSRRQGTGEFSDPDIQRGTHIGPYKTLSVLGEGGCGMVYLAESEKPIKRLVALKVIKPGMDSKQVLARFEVERQALAVMDHPGVAKVFDAGTTDAGRPYFVMEYVKGLPITRHCDQHRLDIKERMTLFVGVCDAVQHAHQKGVIHRDIKPTNLLVSVDGNRDIPKVIDFGLAKAMNQSLTDSSLYTHQGQIIGTPAYMSPEQAEVTAQDIDTRADIYSLGVVLYELLTGVLPFERKLGSDEQLRRAVRERDPSTPSSQLARLSADRLTDVTQFRNIEARELLRELKGDLDWIVLKCLEHDRMRRYETANGLALDIRRYLDNEPVLARPPSSLYRLSKLARRNKAAFVAAVAVLLSLIGGLTFATWGFANAANALKKAEEAREKLERQNYLVHLGAANQALLVDDYGRGQSELDACKDIHPGWEWQLLRERLEWEFMPIEGGGPPIFTQDGQRLISIGPGDDKHGNAALIWDLTSGNNTVVGTLTHDSPLITIAMSPDEKRVAAGDHGGNLIVWDSATNEKQVHPRHENALSGIGFSADGSLIATVCRDELKVMDANGGDECFSVSFHNLSRGSHLRGVAFSPDPTSRWLATSIHLVDTLLIDWTALSARGNGYSTTIEELLATGDAVKLGEGQILPTFSPTHKDLIATGKVDEKQGIITLWRCNGKEWLPDGTIGTGDKAVWALSFRADGKRLASGHFMSGIKVWDVEANYKNGPVEPLASLRDMKDFPRYLAFRPGSDQIAFSSSGDRMRMWRDSKPRDSITKQPFAIQIPIEVVRFSPDGSRILVGIADGRTAGWRINNSIFPQSESQVQRATHSIVIVDVYGKEIHALKGAMEGAAWLSGDGRKIAVSRKVESPERFAVHEVDIAEGTSVQRSEEDARVVLLSIPAREQLISVGRNGNVRNFELPSFDPKLKEKFWDDPDLRFSTAAASPRGKYLAMSFYNESAIKVWDIQGQRREPVIIPSLGQVVHMRFTQDDQHVFVAANGGRLERHNVGSSGQEPKRFIGHRGYVTAIAADPQETQIVAADSSGQVIVWDVESQRQLVTLTDDDVAVLSVDWSPDGKRIVAGKEDGWIQIWKLPDPP